MPNKCERFVKQTEHQTFPRKCFSIIAFSGNTSLDFRLIWDKFADTRLLSAVLYTALQTWRVDLLLKKLRWIPNEDVIRRFEKFVQLIRWNDSLARATHAGRAKTKYNIFGKKLIYFRVAEGIWIKNRVPSCIQKDEREKPKQIPNHTARWGTFWW